MEELKRFLNSIDFLYDNELDNTYIDKVVLKKDISTYYVYLKSKNVLSYELVNNLFLACKKGINGKDKCFINLEYENITIDNVLNYTKNIIDDIVFEHPSIVGVIDNIKEIKDKEIIIEVSNQNNKKVFLGYIKNIIDSLKNYGMGDYTISIEVNSEIEKVIKEEIEKEKEINSKKEEKKDDNILLGFHKDGDVTLIKNIVGEQKGIIIEGYIFGIDAQVRKGQKATAYIKS